MAKTSVMIDLNDPRTSDIAEVMTNSSCKKILGILADRECSESEISKNLGIPINTVGYNIKKLLNAGLIEETGRKWWSVKGKKINKYKLSNTQIVISPKTIIRGVLPALIITGGVALILRSFVNSKVSLQSIPDNAPLMLEKSANLAAGSTSVNLAYETSGSLINVIATNVWLYFIAGAVSALFIYLVWNYWRNK